MLGGTTSRLVDRQSFGFAGDVVTRSGIFLVLHETDALRLTVPASTTGQCYVSGALLSGDPT